MLVHGRTSILRRTAKLYTTEDVRQEVNLRQRVAHNQEQKMEMCHTGSMEDMEILNKNNGNLGPFCYSSDNWGVWRWYKRKLLPLAPSCSLSYHLKHSSLCQAASQPAIWAGDAMPTHLLAVKDVPLEADECHFNLTVGIYGLG